MTAAQALGHTKNQDAIAPLVVAVNDSNEVVACTALAGLEEIRSGSTGGSLPSEVITAIKGCLKDARWRVRAAAAEITGKLKISEAADELKSLLDDPDSFVVKSALAALEDLGSAPESTQLAALSKRLPSLRSETIKLMLESRSEENIKTITEMYENSGNDDQLAILQALSVHVSTDDNSNDAGWKPLLAKASASADPRQRRATATLLARRSPRVAAEMVEPLLADSDAQTRAEAADVVLALMADKRIVNVGHGRTMFVDYASFQNRSPAVKTNKALLTPDRFAAWHASLLKNTPSPAEIKVAAALFATGDGKSDLPLLQAAFEKADSKMLKNLKESTAVPVVVRKLPWPEGKPVIDIFCRNPWLFAVTAAESEKSAAGLADYLLDPARFKTAVEPVGNDDLQDCLTLLIGGWTGANSSGWTLLSGGPRSEPVAMVLLDSTNAAWRAAAVYALGQSEPAKHIDIFNKASKDTNSWVRIAAIQSASKALPDRHLLEERVGPFVGEDDLPVAHFAAIALLEDEVRQAAGLQWRFDFFQFDKVYAGRNISINANDDRPLTALEGRPPFLESARKKLPVATNSLERTTFALLLAQYGDPIGLDQLLAENIQPEHAADTSLSDSIMAGIALIHDAKYVPYLRKVMDAQKNEWELRKVLKALKGMNGPEARQLRLEVNKRMRAGTSGAPD